MVQLHTGSRGSERRLDLIHIILGIVITVMAVMAFINPEENMVLFPLIFFAAALIRIINAVYTIRMSNHDRKVSRSGRLELAGGLLILAVGIVSAISIWA